MRSLGAALQDPEAFGKYLERLVPAENLFAEAAERQTEYNEAPANLPVVSNPTRLQNYPPAVQYAPEGYYLEEDQDPEYPLDLRALQQ